MIEATCLPRPLRARDVQASNNRLRRRASGPAFDGVVVSMGSPRRRRLVLVMAVCLAMELRPATAVPLATEESPARMCGPAIEVCPAAVPGDYRVRRLIEARSVRGRTSQ